MQGDDTSGADAPLTADSLLDALERPALRPLGPDLLVEVPAPVHPSGSVPVRVRPCDDRWLLDDDGALAAAAGGRLDPVVAELRRAGLELALGDDGRLTAGPCDGDDLPAAVLRFASALAVVPVALSLSGGAGDRSSVPPGDRGTSDPELWTDDHGDWGSESSRESARRFQEDSLRRWAG